ncbi:hypothetical protein CLOSCI_00893 [[Clostridium] scindens ATCC 35704]|uniref:hypothetical protein n=1 Tax=Clostridium scindens (strain JCM 10418 / VPI 12708) TaxID=29347 RepID=UPI0001658FFC|nr:hypothetical protein CLOSCI_00893 [[Clostridium] scindens ATCC 35704]
MKLKYNQSASPQILSDLSSVFAKEVGDFFEMESKSLIKSGLKIPRSYKVAKEGAFMPSRRYRYRISFLQSLSVSSRKQIRVP